MTFSDWLGVGGILATLVVGVGAFVLGSSSVRPKLRVAGGGTGGAGSNQQDLMLTSVNVTNDPSFFGLKVHREAARMTEARIYDPELQELVGPCLMWRNGQKGDLSRENTIESGLRGQLYLFAKQRYAKEYFVYYADALDHKPQSADATYEEKKKEFSLVLRDANQRWYVFDLVARNTDQSVHVIFRRRLRGRLYLLRHVLGVWR
jgi:hypothetical protein